MFKQILLTHKLENIDIMLIPWNFLVCVLFFFIHLFFASHLRLSEELHCSEKHNLDERQKLSQNQPDVDHPDVWGGGQALHLADEDGGHDQHGGQVNAEGGLEEEWLEKGGGVGDGDQ